MNIFNDDDLPLWLHTSICILIGMMIACFFWVDALPGFFEGRMSPLWNFETGRYLFCSHSVQGLQAMLQALGLFFLGLANFSLVLTKLRQLAHFGNIKYLPAFVFLVIFLIVYFNLKCF